MKKSFVVIALVLLSTVAPAFADCSTLTNISEFVPQLFVGQPVHFNFEFIGGTEPYRFEIVSGTLPAGLHLTPSGGLRGKPTQPADETVFVQVTDAAGCQLTVAYPVRVE